MKYIAIFDIPDDYKIGCASAKICQGGKDIYAVEDYEDAYAHVEPLAEQQAEVFDRFLLLEKVMINLGLDCAFDMPGFWTNNRENYKVIPTKFHKGYMQALKDVEKDIRKAFGFSEIDNTIMPLPMWPKDGE